MGRLRGINRKGLIALSLKLEKEADDARKEFKRYGYYSSSTLSYEETLLVIRAIKYVDYYKGKTTEQYLKEESKFRHGGKRKGSGRPKGEPTKTMRIPVSKIEEIKKIVGGEITKKP